jgi:hypothetical protein
MLRKRNGPKRKSVVMTLLRDIQGTPAQKLVIFEKLKAAGGFRDEDPAELREAEQMMRPFAATDKVGIEPRIPPIARR